MKLLKYLANLGYGSRREVARLFHDGRVTRGDGRPLAEHDLFVHDNVLVDGRPLDIAPGALIMLHKPVGYVCSTRDQSRVVYELLPPRFAHRSPIIAPVGRLDLDTSGLLLLTDDGQLNHRITSPRSHLTKIYEAHLAEPLRGDEGEQFASGTMVLHNEPAPLLPATLHVVDERTVRITLTEGRYHQVRRMFAAVGNHVTSLCRLSVGSVQLGNLAEGAWRILDATEMARVHQDLQRGQTAHDHRSASSDC